MNIFLLLCQIKAEDINIVSPTWEFSPLPTWPPTSSPQQTWPSNAKTFAATATAWITPNDNDSTYLTPAQIAIICVSVVVFVIIITVIILFVIIKRKKKDLPQAIKENLNSGTTGVQIL